MKKFLIPVLIIAIIVIGGIFIYKNLTKEETQIFLSEKNTMPEVLKGKKIAMVIAFRDFRDEEYFIPKEIFEAGGANVKTASNEKGTAIGTGGGEANVDLLEKEIDPANFDAVVFVGGQGCLKALDNEISYNLIKEAVSQNKVLGSICISPVILAKAGVLQGKKATVWSSPLDKFAVKVLRDSRANYQSAPVVVDGKIITAAGPFAAKEFAEAIIKIINSATPSR
jgi:protease I